MILLRTGDMGSEHTIQDNGLSKRKVAYGLLIAGGILYLIPVFGEYRILGGAAEVGSIIALFGMLLLTIVVAIYEFGGGIQ